jgi:hypothetical protein
MTRGHAFALGCLAALVGGCAPIPPPDSLREVRGLGGAAAVVAATKVAPAARAHADALAREADRALVDGDFAGAQLLAERARAAFELTLVEARVVRALERRVRAEADERTSASELATLDVENQRLAAEIADVERRIAEAERSLRKGGAQVRSAEEERRRVFEQSRFEAQVACAAAELLTPEASASPSAAFGSPLATGARLIAELEADARATTEGVSDAALHRAASSVRACLESLDELRRRTPRAVDETATLLVELEREGFESVDEREGVLVRTGLLPGARRLEPEARGRLAKLASIAARRGLSLLVVARTREAEGPLPLLDGAMAALRDEAARAGLVAARVVGPLVARAVASRLDPSGPYAAKNDGFDLILIQQPGAR